MQIVAKKIFPADLLQLELGRELMVLSQKMVHALITLVLMGYVSCSVLLFLQIQKELAMPNTKSSEPEKFSSLCSSE